MCNKHYYDSPGTVFNIEQLLNDRRFFGATSDQKKQAGYASDLMPQKCICDYFQIVHSVFYN